MTEKLSLSALVVQSAPLASSASKQFLLRPGLHAVAAQLLRDELLPQQPGLAGDLLNLWLASPTGRGAKFKGYRMTLLMEVLVQHYLSGTPITLVQNYDFLTRQKGAEQPESLSVDMFDVQVMINEWAPRLLDAFVDALAQFWGAARGAEPNRWQWFADYLRSHLKLEVEREVAAGHLDHAQAAAALVVVAFPEAQQRVQGDSVAPTHATLLRIDSFGDVQFDGPALTYALVIRRHLADRQIVLLYSPISGIEAYDSLQALADSMGTREVAKSASEQMKLSLFEPSGNIFAAQAQALAEQQAVDVRLLGLAMVGKASGPSAVFELSQAIEQATCLFEIDTAQEQKKLAELRGAMPAWLVGADYSSRRLYAAHLSELATLHTDTRGKSFLDGIPTIEDFTAQALLEHMRQQHPAEALPALADVEVHLLTAPNADLAIINAGNFTLQDQCISLTDLALFNLSGRPSGHLQIKPRSGAVLPAWLDAAAVEALVQSVDAGAAYLALLRHQLRSDPQQATMRRDRYVQQLRRQLPMVALEAYIRGLHGFTRAGFDLVERVLLTGDSHAMLATLGFVSRPGAHADLVSDMFVFANVDDSDGPHVLYRPLFQPTLLEYPDRASLFAAIKQPGALQRSVLDWLSESARAVYAEGGFDEPHIVRFGQGSDFAPIDHPAPAVISCTAVIGDVPQVLYSQTVEALLTCADRRSVSNAENRWIAYGQLGWTLFNALLPLVSGPIATAGWMLQTLNGLQEALQARANGNAEAIADVFTDFLFNSALILLGEGLSHGLEHKAVAVPVPPSGARPELERPLVVTLRHQVRHHIVSQLDFSWASPLNTLSPGQRSALAKFAMIRPAHLAPAVPHGPWKGLFQHDGRWLAEVDGSLFMVELDGQTARVVHPADPAHLGPWLRKDEIGRWRLDLRMRLAGGSPKKTVVALRTANEQAAIPLKAELEAFVLADIKVVERLNKIRMIVKHAAATQSPGLAQARDHYTKGLEERASKLLAAIDACTRLAELQVRSHALEHKARLLQSYCTDLIGLLSLRDADMLDLKRKIRPLLDNEAEVVSEDEQRQMAEFDRDCTQLLTLSLEYSKKLEVGMQQLQGVRYYGDIQLAEVKKYWKERHGVLYAASPLLEMLGIIGEEKLADHPLGEGLGELIKPVRLAVQSAAALSEAEFTVPERAQVLESVIARYGSLLEALQFYQGLDSQLVWPYELTRLADLVNELLARAKAALEPLARSLAEQNERAKKTKPKRQKALIRTRSHGMVIGHWRDAPGVLRDVVDLVDPVNNETLASFRREPDGEGWEQMPGSPAKKPSGAASKRVLKTVNELMQSAQSALDAIPGQLQAAKAQARVAQYPSEMEDIMRLRSERLVETADALDKLVVRSNQTDLADTEHASVELRVRLLREKAVELIEQGRLMRIERVKTLPPDAGRVDYLRRQGEVSVRKVGGRKHLATSQLRDYLQEYEVRDKHGQPLWYAHFHYASALAPATAYTRAHLKTSEQRKLGYQAQLAQHLSGKEVIEIQRSRIDPPLDQQLFLSLEDQTQDD